MRKFAFCAVWLIVLSGCAPAAAPTYLAASMPALTASPPPNTVTAAPQPTPTAGYTSTSTPLPLPSPSLTPTRGVALCSPLEGITLSELSSPDLLKNPFQRPRPGWDEAHHGVDFAYWSRGERKSMRGHPILAALGGRVAAVLPDRMPYGNAIIIETQLDALPPAWLDSLPSLRATPAPTVQALSLSCPPTQLQAGSTSLYLLYAHLDQPSPRYTGQTVACGDPIGTVGTTGYSVNDHLHLETRLGPAGVTFDVMGHYQNDVTEAEMSAYCAWRVSGLFEMLDPMDVLSLQP